MLSEMHSHSVCHRWTGRYFHSNIHVYSIKGTRTETSELADFRISSFENLGVPCRCRNYQSKSTLPTIEADIYNVRS